MPRIRLTARFLLPNAVISDRKFAIRYTRTSSFSSQPQTSLEKSGPLASHLKSRSVIRFRGPETIKFLQGLLTNDLRRLEENPSFANEGDTKSKPTGNQSLPTSNMPMASFPPIYAAMLNAQGRFLYDFFLYRPSRPDAKFDQSGKGPGPNPREIEIFADVDNSVVDELCQTLKKFRLRSKVDIENVDGEFRCWQHYGGKLFASSSSSEEPQASGIGWAGNVDRSAVSSAHGSEEGWQWYKDPRLDCLGFRGLFPSNTIPPLVEADNETAEENYLLWRIEKGVAEGSAEIPKGESIPLEYNLAGLNAISFDKGCYVGQELVARTEHRGVIRKRLLPLKFVNDRGEAIQQRVAPGSAVVNHASSKTAGSVTTALGSRGLGLLRLEEAFPKGSRSGSGSGSLVVEGSEDVKVEAIRPDWWPAEWLHDH